MGSHGHGSKNNNWRGGRSVTQSGYILLRVGKRHHLADVRGYAYEHRVVAEKSLGRKLRPGRDRERADQDDRAHARFADDGYGSSHALLHLLDLIRAASLKPAGLNASIPQHVPWRNPQGAGSHFGVPFDRLQSPGLGKKPGQRE